MQPSFRCNNIHVIDYLTREGGGVGGGNGRLPIYLLAFFCSFRRGSVDKKKGAHHPWLASWLRGLNAHHFS